MCLPGPSARALLLIVDEYSAQGSLSRAEGSSLEEGLNEGRQPVEAPPLASDAGGQRS